MAITNILDELKWRGLIKDFSNEEKIKEFLNNPVTLYCGFDPSASSMHIGNYVMISLLKRFQLAGHKIIALVGGATGMIGDPSGKSKERNLQDTNTLKANTDSIRHQLERFIDLSDENKGILLNNYDWLSKLSMLDFLRDFGKYFSINYMLSKDIVASRLESGISFTEFSYQILQSIDFYHLFKTYNCQIQLGGGDQWGNLTSGLELIHKILGDVDVGVLTSHLITRSDGKKFGKSEDGALFLDPKLTSPYKLYQYFLNTSDDDAVKYLKVFTFLTMEEINNISREHYEHLGARIAQKALAFNVTKDIHGEDAANEAKMMSEVLFSGEVKKLSKANIEELLGGLEVKMTEGLNILEVLINAKAASSKREAREFVNNGSISINGEKCQDLDKVITKADTLHDQYIILRRGKKNYYLINLK